MRAVLTDLHRRGDRDQCEGVRDSVAHLAVAGVGRDRKHGKFDGGDQFVGVQLGLQVRCRAGQPVELGQRDVPRAARAFHLDRGVQRRERHCHVGRMGGDAVVARPQHCVAAVEPLQRGAPGARLALVARRRLVVEVQAAGALQQVSPNRRHVPQLPGSTMQDRLGQHRIPGADQGVRGQPTVAHQCADPKPAIGEFLDLVQRQPGDVDDRLRPFDALTHQVDEVGATGEELCPRFGGDRLEGRIHVSGAHVREGLHGATSLMASTMPL